MSINAVIVIAACLIAGVALANLVAIYMDNRAQKRQRAELINRVSDNTESIINNHSTKESGSRHINAIQASNKPKPPAKKPARLKLHIPGLFGSNSRKDTQQQLAYDSELAMLLDITALGMRAGMAFDQAFELALRRSPGELPEKCLAKLEIWQKGLISRQQGMQELADEIQTVMFSRFVALVLRALRYGAPMTQLLNVLSDETRRDIRVRREEEVAKAPVKMLIPTGTLILPAMLLLVLGPIMLDLLGKM
ncbi:MAG: type II secretion system F family protein [Coriobacteriales bacterium]|jgi:tight adherence protein C|nr:type II secretion system F family protein [Coriobacteriales bacterium]